MPRRSKQYEKYYESDKFREKRLRILRNELINLQNADKKNNTSSEVSKKNRD